MDRPSWDEYFMVIAHHGLGRRDVEDAAQDLFLTVHRVLHTFDPERQRPLALRLHAPSGVLGRGLIPVRHAHLRPFLREPERARAPDAAAAASDHRDLAREPSRHRRSSPS